MLLLFGSSPTQGQSPLMETRDGMARNSETICTGPSSDSSSEYRYIRTTPSAVMGLVSVCQHASRLNVHDPATISPPVSSLMTRSEVIELEGGLLLLNIPSGFRCAQPHTLQMYPAKECEHMNTRNTANLSYSFADDTRSVSRVCRITLSGVPVACNVLRGRSHWQWAEKG